MDSLLNSAVEEICSHLQTGLPLQTLFSNLLEDSYASSSLKQALWDSLRSIPTLKFLSPKNQPYSSTDPSILSFQSAVSLNLHVIADDSLINSFMGLYNVPSANANLSSVQRNTLHRLAAARTKGVTQTELAKEMGIEGRNFHYAVKNLECQGLLVRKSALLRMKDGREEGNNPSVTTNMLYLYRHAKNLGAQQKMEVVKEDIGEEGFGNVDGDVSGGNVCVKDFLPAMKAVCDKLEEANGKVT